MATDINTQLQNISTDVTAIGTLVNRLITIFSGGGVQNPDLAALKGELQTELQTAINNLGNSVLHKSGDETFSGKKTSNGYFVFTRAYSVVAYYDFSLSATTYPTDSIKTFYFSRVGDSQNNYVSDDAVTADPAYVMKTIRVVNPVSNKVASITLRSNRDTSTVVQITTNTNIEGILYPASTNTYSLGSPSRFWSQVFASNGTIQTSDKNLKAEISDIPEIVMRAWSKVKFKQFKMKDAVAKKGNNARIHMGVIANEDVDSIQQAFQSEGLDARNYGLFCYDEWEDQYEDKQILVKPEVRGQVKVVDVQAMYNTIIKEDGSEEQVLVSPEKSHMEEQVIEEAQYRTEKVLVQPAGSRYSVRYEECLALECAYQRWELNKIKVKLGI